MQIYMTGQCDAVFQHRQAHLTIAQRSSETQVKTSCTMYPGGSAEKSLLVELECIEKARIAGDPSAVFDPSPFSVIQNGVAGATDATRSGQQKSELNQSKPPLEFSVLKITARNTVDFNRKSSMPNFFPLNIALAGHFIRIWDLSASRGNVARRRCDQQDDCDDLKNVLEGKPTALAVTALNR